MNTNDWFYGKPGSWPDGEAAPAEPVGELREAITQLIHKWKTEYPANIARTYYTELEAALQREGKSWR